MRVKTGSRECPWRHKLKTLVIKHIYTSQFQATVAPYNKLFHLLKKIEFAFHTSSHVTPFSYKSQWKTEQQNLLKYCYGQRAFYNTESASILGYVYIYI